MIILVGASLTASACQTRRETSTVVGAGAGAVVGGVIGGTGGALVGAALGGMAGYGVGRAMEENDRRRIAYALEQNQPASWTNPDTGYEYRVQPSGTVVQGGRECREFRVIADMGTGQPEEVTGFACRQPDGDWEVSG